MQESSWGWRGEADINLARLSLPNLDKLSTLIAANKQIYGAGVALKDIETWKEACNDTSQVKPRTVPQFCALLQKFLFKVPGHRIYMRFDDNVRLAYYVNEVEYIPKREDHGHITPEHVNLELLWEEFGGKKREKVTFWEGDCRAMTIPQSLSLKGYTCETKELREAYLGEQKRFNTIVDEIGKQYLSSGTATDDLDGNPDSSDGYWHKSHTIQMVRNGEPTRVVVDVFYEDEKTNRRDNDRVHISQWFWRNAEHRKFSAKGDDEDEIDENDDDIPEVEVPVHPFAAVFDLSKHLRMRAHVNYLSEYVYDKELSEKLIMPDELKALVEMLIAHKDGGFKDIVKGKSGGAVVLLAGPPGVGKTLTAEVYAESEGRALYSVQCSQLGIKPEDLESELLKIFERARRWKAVLLLDEADVYVHERGNDLLQNAIVGVFLRVLEYQDSVLFLTTNRPDDVDDAIGSRCVARLTYVLPTTEEQTRIWRVLADASNIEITDETIAEIVRRSPGLSGRDVKNLLKLGHLVSLRTLVPISADAIDFVKRFKPTGKAP